MNTFKLQLMLFADFLAGLLSKRKESMKHFNKYFGWKYKFMPTNQEACRMDWLVKGVIRMKINLQYLSQVLQHEKRCQNNITLIF